MYFRRNNWFWDGNASSPRVFLYDWNQCISLGSISFLMEMLQCHWDPDPPPVYISYSILIQNWWESSLEHPSPPQYISFIQFPFKNDKRTWSSGSSPLFQCIFLTQFSFKADEYLLCGIPPHQIHIPYAFFYFCLFFYFLCNSN